MNKPVFAAVSAASISLWVVSAAHGSDARTLNKEAIQAMRLGDLRKAEDLFKLALSKCTPDQSNFDLCIKNNLNVLSQHKLSTQALKDRAKSLAGLII